MRSARAGMRAGLIAALAIGAGMGLAPVQAQTPDVVRLVKCPTIRENAARLACFDTAMNPPTTGFDPNAIADTPTPPVAPLSSAAAVRVVQADDAFVAPSKYVGQMIAIPGMKCLHADQGDYRCSGTGALIFAVFAKAVSSQVEREAIERECGELSKTETSPRCLKTIRFTPTKAETDVVSGFQQRVIMRADTIEIEDASMAARPVSTRR